MGVAPDANLISIKASDDDGNSTVLDVIAGIHFAVDHKDEYNIRVLNLSLESTVAESYKTDPLDAAVEAAWFKGIFVVAAAGNRGSDADAVSYAPGNDPYIVSVGAVDDQGTKSIYDDKMASWSSRGMTQDGFAKPDVFAPGARIVSNLAPRSAFTSLCPECVVDGQYIRAGGLDVGPDGGRRRGDRLPARPVPHAQQGEGAAAALGPPAVRGHQGGLAVERRAHRRAGGQHHGQPRAHPEHVHRPRHGRDRLRALELEPVELELRLLRRRRRVPGRPEAVELEPLELVHELEQVAPLQRMSTWGAAVGPGRRYPRREL